ncbi:hypothetical protein MUK42_27141, partial [Musa troglodytarum]
PTSEDCGDVSGASSLSSSRLDLMGTRHPKPGYKSLSPPSILLIKARDWVATVRSQLNPLITYKLEHISRSPPLVFASLARSPISFRSWQSSLSFILPSSDSINPPVAAALFAVHNRFDLWLATLGTESAFASCPELVVFGDRLSFLNSGVKSFEL